MVGQTIVFIDKVAKARQEASGLYNKIRRLDKLLKNIKDFLESRETGSRRGPTSAAEESLEDTVKDTLDECRNCLEITNHELEPLTRVPRGQISGIANRLKFVFTDKFIKSQEKQVESYFQSLSICSHLLQGYGDRAKQKVTEDLIEQEKHTQRLLVRLVTDIHQFGLDLQASASHSPESDVRQLLLRQELTEALNEATADHSLPEDEIGREGGEMDDVEDTLQRRDTIEDDDSSAIDAALRIAVKHNQDDIVRGLRQSGANIGIQDAENLTLLHYAILMNAERALDALLHADAQPPSLEWLDTQSKRGLTALMYTAMLADPDKCVILARALISRGCSVNIKDGEGRSAICFAIDGGPSPERKDLVKLLLESRAEPEPAFEWAEEQARRYPDLQEQLSAIQQHESDRMDNNSQS